MIKWAQPDFRGRGGLPQADQPRSTHPPLGHFGHFGGGGVRFSSNNSFTDPTCKTHLWPNLSNQILKPRGPYAGSEGLVGCVAILCHPRPDMIFKANLRTLKSVKTLDKKSNWRKKSFMASMALSTTQTRKNGLFFWTFDLVQRSDRTWTALGK